MEGGPPQPDDNSDGGWMKIFGIVGHSGMGKTTLLERLIPDLVQRGLRVSLVKHSHKSIDVDLPGKDSYRLREAGCADVVIVGRDRWAVVHELRDDPEPDFEEIQASLRPCDVLLVEGLKALRFPKLEVWRAGLDRLPLCGSLPGISAIATDHAVPENLVGSLQRLRLDDVCGIGDFVVHRATTQHGPTSQQLPLPLAIR
jgi:molybdopterin-guanine dinucleotide biosynthesis protein B